MCDVWCVWVGYNFMLVGCEGLQEDCVVVFCVIVRRVSSGFGVVGVLMIDVVIGLKFVWEVEFVFWGVSFGQIVVLVWILFDFVGLVCMFFVMM